MRRVIIKVFMFSSQNLESCFLSLIITGGAEDTARQVQEGEAEYGCEHGRAGESQPRLVLPMLDRALFDSCVSVDSTD